MGSTPTEGTYSPLKGVNQLPGMMHANCRLRCCLRGSRADDKREVREELRQEFLADVPPEVEAEDALVGAWHATHAPYVEWADEFPHTPETNSRPRAWQV